MEYLEIPVFPVLRDDEAIDALNEYITEVGEQSDEQLTQRQIDALTKIAKGLISSIESAQEIEKASLDVVEETLGIRELEEEVSAKRVTVEQLESKRIYLEKKLKETVSIEENSDPRCSYMRVSVDISPQWCSLPHRMLV